MRRVAKLFNLHWWDVQSPEKKAEIRRYVEELVNRYQLKVVEFPGGNPDFIEFAPVDADSQRFRDLMEDLQELDGVSISLRIERLYSRQELEAAPLLELDVTNQAIEDDYYDLNRDKAQAKGMQPYLRLCEACRAPLEQVRDMVVVPSKMGKRDLSKTYFPYQLVLSPRLARLLEQSDLTGFRLRPVWGVRNPYQGEPPLYQLMVTHVLPPLLSPPTQLEKVPPELSYCSACGRRAYSLKTKHYWGKFKYTEERGLYYSKRVLEQAKDFNLTEEWFEQFDQVVIIRQRVYRLLRDQGMKGWAVVPVQVVE